MVFYMQKEKEQRKQKECRSYSDSVRIRKQNIKSISWVGDSVAVNQNSFHWHDRKTLLNST